MSSTTQLRTIDSFRFPKGIKTAINKLNDRITWERQEEIGEKGLEPDEFPPILTVNLTKDKDGLQHIQIISNKEYQGYKPGEPFFDLKEGASNSNGIMRDDDSSEYDLATAIMFNIDDMNYDNYNSRYDSEYPYNKEFNEYENVVCENFWENTEYETKPLPKEEDLETILGQFVSYAAGEDSEEYVSGQITPAEAALSFIQANPQYAKYAVKIGSAYNREDFIKRVDQAQNDGDQFQRYDIDELADRTALSSDYANANPNAAHYDEVAAETPRSAFGPGSNEILSNHTKIEEIEQPVKSVAELEEEQVKENTL
jgi:hypothetical protein